MSEAVGKRAVTGGVVGAVGAAPAVVSVRAVLGTTDFTINAGINKPAGVGEDASVTLALVSATDKRKVDNDAAARLDLPQGAVASPWECECRVEGLLANAEYRFAVSATWTGGKRSEFLIDAARFTY